MGQWISVKERLPDYDRYVKWATKTAQPVTSEEVKKPHALYSKEVNDALDKDDDIDDFLDGIYHAHEPFTHWWDETA